MAPPGPVKIGHKKDGRRRRPHRFHVSRPPPYPAAGSATGVVCPGGGGGSGVSLSFESLRPIRASD